MEKVSRRLHKANPKCYTVLCFVSDGLRVLPTEYHNKSEAINVARSHANNGAYETCVVAEYPTEDVEEWNSKDGFVCNLIGARGF